jgi:hypothetical protein
MALGFASYLRAVGRKNPNAGFLPRLYAWAKSINCHACCILGLGCVVLGRIHRIDAREFLRHGMPMRWPHQPGYFWAMGQDNHRRLLLDLKRPTQRPARAIIHLEVLHRKMGG